tara:strand:+ start:64 stop:306 length:243 start_codon:yes stop_codon:yes gene_type:complete
MKTLIKDIKKVVKSNEFKNDEIQIEQLLLDFIKKDRAKQLILSGVRQQSELLLDFWMKMPKTHKHKGVAEHYIDNYLKSN